MMWWIAGSVVALAGKWANVESDVATTLSIGAPIEAVHAEIADLAALRNLVPADCATQWVLGEPTRGVGAQGQVRYTFGPLRRELTAVIKQDEPGRLFEIEHLSRRGWFTQVRYDMGSAPSEGRTSVTLLTPLTAPPWPFKGVFFRKVRPAMVSCYERTLKNLAERFTS